MFKHLGQPRTNFLIRVEVEGLAEWLFGKEVFEQKIRNLADIFLPDCAEADIRQSRIKVRPIHS